METIGLILNSVFLSQDVNSTEKMKESQVGACVATPVRNTLEPPVVQKMPEGNVEPTADTDAKVLCEQVAAVEVSDSPSVDETHVQTQKAPESPQHVEPSADSKGNPNTTEPDVPPVSTAETLKLEASRKACNHVFTVSNHEFIGWPKMETWMVVLIILLTHQLQSPISIPMQAKLRNAAKSQLNRWVKVHKRHPQKTAPEWLQKEWREGCKSSIADLLSHCNFNKDRFTGIFLDIFNMCTGNDGWW